MDKNMKNWLWEHEDYPNYTYDKESLRPSLEKIDELVSAVNTAFAGLDERTQREVLALSACDELISSFKIEGILPIRALRIWRLIRALIGICLMSEEFCLGTRYFLVVGRMSLAES